MQTKMEETNIENKDKKEEERGSLKKLTLKPKPREAQKFPWKKRHLQPTKVQHVATT